MVELLQSGEKSGESRQAASSLNALLTGGARKKAAVRFIIVQLTATCSLHMGLLIADVLSHSWPFSDKHSLRVCATNRLLPSCWKRGQCVRKIKHFVFGELATNMV